MGSTLWCSQTHPFLSAPGQRDAWGGAPSEAGQALMLASAGPVDFFSQPVQASRLEGTKGRGLGGVTFPRTAPLGGSVCLAASHGLLNISVMHVSPHGAP